MGYKDEMMKNKAPTNVTSILKTLTTNTVNEPNNKHQKYNKSTFDCDKLKKLIISKCFKLPMAYEKFNGSTFKLNKLSYLVNLFRLGYSDRPHNSFN